jgi:hypothetical protein
MMNVVRSLLNLSAIMVMFASTATCLAKPLQGEVEVRPSVSGSATGTLARPIRGDVDKSKGEQLKGGVDRATDPPLQGGVDRNADPTLRGGVGKSADTRLQGGVGKNATVPLTGGVEDASRSPLQGRVDGKGELPLRAGIPSYSAVMRILQFKDTGGPPPNVPPPISQEEIERARFRDNPQSQKMPLRAIDNGTRSPIHGDVTDQPPPRPEFAGRPQRADISVPQRPEYSAPQRSDIGGDTPPARYVSDSIDRPMRNFQPLPVSNVNVIPNQVSIRPVDAANVLTGPLPNARILQPDESREIPRAPLRATPEGFQVKRDKKKKRDKKTEIEAEPKSRLQTAPQLVAPINESLLWDPWYQHVNALVCQAIRKSMPKYGNPAGTNRVHITVWPDHKIEVRLIEGSNPKFNDAILEAYKSLDLSAELKFPHGTQRKQNDYEIAHIQEIPATTASFESRTIRGDLETLLK